MKIIQNSIMNVYHYILPSCLLQGVLVEKKAFLYANLYTPITQSYSKYILKCLYF